MCVCDDDDDDDDAFLLYRFYDGINCGAMTVASSC